MAGIRNGTTRPALLLTRPEAQSRRFGSAFRARFGDDWPVIQSPLSRLDLLAASLNLDGAAGLIFTSETAVRAFCGLSPRRDLPAWCVGPRTAMAARAAGLTTVEGPGDGTRLAATIREARPAGPLVHVHGRHLATDLAALLRPAGMEVRSITAYDQVALAPTPEALEMLCDPAPVLLPLFSPRAAHLLAQVQPLPAAPLLIAAISQAVADAATPLAPAQTVIARQPNSPAILDALAALIAAVGAGAPPAA